MSCNHYMQFWNILGRWHAIDRYKFGACDTYAMPPAIAMYCFMLCCIALYYFKLQCIPNHIEPIGLIPSGLYDMHYAIITCSSGAWVSTCYSLVICSSLAWEAYAMSSLHAISELMVHMACSHYMQFWSSYVICHITIKCRSGVLMAHTMPLLSAISELARHMPCPQLLLCIALSYIASYYTTL